jgi:hypothetical protein
MFVLSADLATFGDGRQQMNNSSNISYNTYLLQVKRVDKILAIILEMALLKFIWL